MPDYDNLEKTVLITHADVGHCGLLPIFDNILIFKTAHCIKNEYEGKGGHLPGGVVLIDYAKKIAIRGLCRKNGKKY